ncbi:unnamed protein product [Schistosoma margrebowiei]|uniref:Uncharacterized protein n=1 Tax=Schistosoma margrebowiei TaxID=48269 RepID=A0AA85AM94_9TREM|nr:unnamed protein product [Schistosoma margrebowiei]
MLIVKDSSMMMNFAFGDASTITNQNNLNCIFERNKDPLVFSGFLLTLIGLVLGLIIMFNNKLHSTSTKNSIFIVITMIIMIVGFALLISCTNWYEVIISAFVANVFTILAILLSLNLHGPERQWKTVLFAICGVIIVTGFILLVLGLILKVKGLLVATYVCWCFVTFIVMIYTIYYLNRHRDEEHLSTLYSLFFVIYEYFLLVINVQLSLNAIIDCQSKNERT